MKGLSKYFNKRHDFLLKLLHKQSCSRKHIHKVRVEIKKFNSLFELIKFCFVDFKKKEIYKPYKEIFLQAGKVRDIQLEEETLKKYSVTDSLKKYRKKLKESRLIEQALFISVAEKKMRLLNDYDKVVPYFSAVNAKRIHRYINKKINQLTAFQFKQVLETAEIHAFRKNLKELIYNMESLGLKPGSWISDNNNILELLGKWHDSQVIIHHLNESLVSSITSSEDKIELEKLIVILSADNIDLLKQVKRSIQSVEFDNSKINQL